jgi:hypothetical protein
MRLIHLSTLLLACMIGLSACSGLTPQDEETPETTALPTLTAIPSATIDWFPVTDTPTLIPTTISTPTPDQRPGLAEQLLSDSFTDQTQWQIVHNDIGNVEFGDQELTIAVSKSKGSLQSLRNTPVLDNFYMEITANPDLCRDADSYGLLVRAGGPLDFYRFSINCDGLIRLERVNHGESYVLQDWVASGEVPTGSPLVLRLGVWAYSHELRFFINDVFQFSAQDSVWKNGKIGVFAHSNEDTPLTVSFYDMQISSIQGVTLPTATLPVKSPTATRRPTATSQPQ